MLATCLEVAVRCQRGRQGHQGGSTVPAAGIWTGSGIWGSSGLAATQAGGELGVWTGIWNLAATQAGGRLGVWLLHKQEKNWR